MKKSKKASLAPRSDAISRFAYMHSDRGLRGVGRPQTPGIYPVQTATGN